MKPAAQPVLPYIGEASNKAWNIMEYQLRVFDLLGLHPPFLVVWWFRMVPKHSDILRRLHPLNIKGLSKAWNPGDTLSAGLQTENKRTNSSSVNKSNI